MILFLFIFVFFFTPLMPTSQGTFLINLMLRTPDPLLIIGHVFILIRHGRNWKEIFRVSWNWTHGYCRDRNILKFKCKSVEYYLIIIYKTYIIGIILHKKCLCQYVCTVNSLKDGNLQDQHFCLSWRELNKGSKERLGPFQVSDLQSCPSCRGVR